MLQHTSVQYKGMKYNIMNTVSLVKEPFLKKITLNFYSELIVYTWALICVMPFSRNIMLCHYQITL